MKSVQKLVLQQKAEPFGIRSSSIITPIKHRKSTAQLKALLLVKARKHTFITFILALKILVPKELQNQ